MQFKIHAQAVIVGVITGFVVSLAIGFLLGIAEPLVHSGPPLNDDPLHVASLAIGFVSTVLGAYLTARLSAADKFANVITFWVTNEVLGLLSLLVTAFPLWYNIVGTLVVLGASLLGWHIERITRRQMAK
jgi:hypothetical protein